jgi:hypothetical protein
MNNIGNNMRRLDVWLRELDVDMDLPASIRSSPIDAAEEIERLEAARDGLLEAASALLTHYARSVNVGPHDNPGTEASLLRKLREAAAKARGEGSEP